MTRFTATARDAAGLDTNVLIYARDRRSPHHEDCMALRRIAKHADGYLCITPQVIVEFYSVVTNPELVEEPLSPTEVIGFFEELLRPPGVRLLEAPGDLASLTVGLAQRLRVRGRTIHDAQLVAAYQSYSIHRLYTYNVSHFNHILGLEVLSPPSADAHGELP